MELFLDFALLMLAAVGFSHILSDGSIISPVKVWLNTKGWAAGKFVEMLNCYQCNGFWSGILVALVPWLAGYIPWFYIPLWGLAISIVSPMIGYLKLYAAIKTSVDDEEMPYE